MSTKALRQLIEAGKAEVLPLDRVVREALAEVEAIERAARDLDAAVIAYDVTGGTPASHRASEGFGLLRRIAKEAKP